MRSLTHQGPHWLETSRAELPAPSSNLQELWEFPRKSGWGTGLAGTPTRPIPSGCLPWSPSPWPRHCPAPAGAHAQPRKGQEEMCLWSPIQGSLCVQVSLVV